MAQVKDQEITSEKEIIDSSATEANLATTDDYNEKANEKVQLDIEDAPFLEEPEEESPEPEESKTEDEEQEVEKPKKSKKKLLFMAGGATALLSVLVVVAYFLFSPNPEEALTPTPEELEAQALAENTYVVVLGGDSPPPPPTPPVFTENLDPFWVQLTTPKGGTIFLVSTFTLTTEIETLARELKSVMADVRDSIYYYLRTKDYNFLTDFKNFPAIKEEMLQLVNRELSAGEYSEILYDNYITK